MKFIIIAAAVLLYMHSRASQPTSSGSTASGSTKNLTPNFDHILSPFIPSFAPPGATMPGAFPVQAPGKANLGMGVLTSLPFAPLGITGGGVTGPTSSRGAGPARI